jgi:hypothetical protein
MRRRILIMAGFLALVAVLFFGTRESRAVQVSSTNRYKTVRIRVTEYVWSLVSNQTGQVVCQIIVDHPNRPTYDETLQICGTQIFPQAPTPTPYGTPAAPTSTPSAATTPQATAKPFDLAEYFMGVAFRFENTQEIDRTVKVPLPEIITNLTVPPGQTGNFYVVAAAYEPIYGERITAITGAVNGNPFTCQAARCLIPIATDSTVEFWAVSSFGDESRHSQATLRLNTSDHTTVLELSSLIPLAFFQDACAISWGTPLVNMPTWASFPPSPDELNTMKPYQYLAGQLLYTGQVKAPECPGGGLISGTGPNACGLEKTSQAVIEWQNQFDVDIWSAARTVGIPPRLIKTMIEQESQFWPANSRRALYEYGLGQISPSGADTALRWDADLFNSVCNGLLYDCSKVYSQLPSWLQATVSGGLMNSLNTECPTCPTGFDLEKVHNSIPVLARTVRANCYQTKYLMSQRAGKPTYEDLWKFTFVLYHSGYDCLARGIDITLFNDQPADWEHVSANLGDCPGAKEYVNNFWTSLSSFDKYRLNKTQTPVPAVFASTPAPATQAPTATPALAKSHLRVVVYVDANQNNTPDPGEYVSGVHVQISFPDGHIVNANTVNGVVDVDLTGRPINEELLVSLPELYRSQLVNVTSSGEVLATFRLEQPVVPPVLP